MWLLFKEGHKTQLRQAFWERDIFTHINEKSSLRAAPQTTSSRTAVSSPSLGSTSIVLPQFSDSPSPSWCQGGCIGPALHPPRFKSKRNRKPSFTPTVKPKLWVWLLFWWDHMPNATLETVDRGWNDLFSLGQVTCFISRVVNQALPEVTGPGIGWTVVQRVEILSPPKSGEHLIEGWMDARVKT